MRVSPLLLLIACGSTERIEGKVVDIWGNPIEGATVMVVGGTERPLTDPDGRYHLEHREGTFTVKAGRKGYIQDHRELVVAPGQKAEGPLFELYPKPEDPGLYVVTTGRYVKLEGRQVHSVGNLLKRFQGIKTLSEAQAESERPRVVFHTELRHDEIMRLGLELHRLDYVRQAELSGPTGPAEVTVNLYVDAGEVPIEVAPLRSKTDYLVTPTEALTPGVYAFQTQDLLSPGENDRFEEIPEELRVVFPFEVR